MLTDKAKRFIRELTRRPNLCDSDLEDYLDEHPEENRTEAWRYFDAVLAEGTPCEGCAHTGLRYGMYPCTYCTRSPEYQHWTDRFSPEGGDHENE